MGLYERHFSDPQRERAFLSAVGFTTAFATARGITHAIRAGVGPFHNISKGGTHIHHSTFGILGLLGIGYLWTYQVGVGVGQCHRWPSRLSASTYGIAAALTLDEFALWLDLHDDYWDKQGRKSHRRGRDLRRTARGRIRRPRRAQGARAAAQGARALRGLVGAACGGIHGAVPPGIRAGRARPRPARRTWRSGGTAPRMPSARGPKP